MRRVSLEVLPCQRVGLVWLKISKPSSLSLTFLDSQGGQQRMQSGRWAAPRMTAAVRRQFTLSAGYAGRKACLAWTWMLAGNSSFCLQTRAWVSPSQVQYPGPVCLSNACDCKQPEAGGLLQRVGNVCKLIVGTWGEMVSAHTSVSLFSFTCSSSELLVPVLLTLLMWTSVTWWG